MGRKRRSRQGERDVSTLTHSIASPFTARPWRPSPSVTHLAFVGSESALPDGRLFHPTPNFRPALTLRGGKASVGLVDRPASAKQRASGMFPRPGSSQTRAVRAFSVPSSVAVCVRRKQRREVLHALGKAGRGGSQRKRRRSQWSHVTCR